jgi:GNAT superfamily N-acetyltransferase
MPQNKIAVRQATVEDLDVLVPLFDAYRQFYRFPGDLSGARQFLLDRFEHNESIIFLANPAAGFTQLYPSFSSGAMRRIFVLNDLFVAPEARRTGTGSALLRAAADYARQVGALRLTLSTQVTNTTAQSLYEREGWKRDTEFYSYQLPLA